MVGWRRSRSRIAVDGDDERVGDGAWRRVQLAIHSSWVRCSTVIVGFYWALTWDHRRFSKHDDVSNGARAILQKTVSL